MRIFLDIPNYDGFSEDVIWDKNANYSLYCSDNEVYLSLNRQGLISLAKQMLYYAFNNFPKGSHVHLDQFFAKNDSRKMDLVIIYESDESET